MGLVFTAEWESEKTQREIITGDLTHFGGNWLEKSVKNIREKIIEKNLFFCRGNKWSKREEGKKFKNCDNYAQWSWRLKQFEESSLLKKTSDESIQQHGDRLHKWRWVFHFPTRKFYFYLKLNKKKAEIVFDSRKKPPNRRWN